MVRACAKASSRTFILGDSGHLFLLSPGPQQTDGSEVEQLGFEPVMSYCMLTSLILMGHNANTEFLMTENALNNLLSTLHAFSSMYLISLGWKFIVTKV